MIATNGCFYLADMFVESRKRSDQAEAQAYKILLVYYSLDVLFMLMSSERSLQIHASGLIQLLTCQTGI